MIDRAAPMRFVSAFLLAFVLAGAARAQSPSPDAQTQAQTLVHLLDYVAVDYPEFVKDGAVLDEAEYAEQAEFAAEVARRLPGLEAGDAPGPLEVQAQRLQAAIAAKANGAEVSAQSIALRDAIVAAFGVAAKPRAIPDLAKAPAVYAENCAMCHGATGHGDGIAGANLDPAPSDFHDDARLQQRSVFGLYNTITLGVGGTGMAAYRHLDDDTRWALAFHVATMRHDEAARAAGKAAVDAAAKPPVRDLAALVATDAKALAASGVADAPAVMAYLLANPKALERGSDAHLDEVRTTLLEAVEAHARGDRDGAVELAVAAYLQGFEPVEALLDTRAPKLRVDVENRMQALRKALRDGAPIDEVRAQVAGIDTALDEVERALAPDTASTRTTALSAFLILFREGLEAILVVAAVLALLVRAQRPEVTKYVHAGWIGALAAGFATWWVARTVVSISGATREITEGIAALLACVILLYVGFWLHGKAHAQAWSAFISKHLKGAMDRRAVWVLAGVSFIAVYREAFETVLFYETLYAQGGATAGTGLAIGFVAAALVLVGIAVAIFRYGMRLPIGPFFKVSAVLMAVLAVVFAGQGIAALQEAGVIDVDPVAFPRFELLGVYPTWQTLAAQAAALAVVAAIYLKPMLVRAAPAPPPAR